MIEWNEILIRLVLASVFGALIGLERERKNWAAGLRTHMMVSVGSCLIMLVSSFGFSDILGTAHVELDPSRIAAQVVSGIGFIGAGTILFQKQGTIRGLTTAAGLWTVAAIGLATGGGMYFAAGATTIIALIILWAIQPLEATLSNKFKSKTLRIVTNSTIESNEIILKLSSFAGMDIESFTINRNEQELVFLITYLNTSVVDFNELIKEIKNDSSIKEIYWVH
ncbi:MAG: MgtC/SapB family protein [Crocinitomicaceae bacterium]|nr:MgtC/SapB family protein [Crocinitomicaceae bacterium]